MSRTDTVTHEITRTSEKRPAGLLPTFGAKCTCHWVKRGLDRDARDEQVDKHKRLAGAVVVK